MLYAEHFDKILNDFKINYPQWYERAIDYYPIGRKRIGIELDDHREMEYDFFTKSIHFLRAAEKDTVDRSEQEWRDDLQRNLNFMMSLRGYTLERLSNATGISMVTLHKYTTGKSSPSGYNLEKISEVLECSIHTLTERKVRTNMNI